MVSGEIVHILKNFGLIFENAGIGGFHLRDTRKRDLETARVSTYASAS
jgi:hypothetical protein